MNQKPDVNIAIVGAGFSGLGMAIKLDKAGLRDDYLVLEAASEVGGTWRDSRYPGAAVDVPNHLYSFSFEQNKEWTRMFSKSEEIQQYILDVVARYNLRPKIQFNTRISEAAFNEEAGLWEVKTTDGKTMTARFVVAAIGPFAKENIPKIKGLDTFKGEQVHTARWKKGLSLKGKKVAVVGSGASAIQVVPAVAKEVAELKVFQRTPSWVVPKLDYEYSDFERLLYRYVPQTQAIRRGIIFGLTELLATGIVYDTPVTSFLEGACKRQMKAAIKDPELLRRVTPDYRLGKTRMLISNDWYPALARDNVELVDHGVDALSEKGVVADGKEYEVDVIIWATGYKSPSEGFPFPLAGRDGLLLHEHWKDGGMGYKGVTVAHYPNLFSIMGPNTGPGHTSVLVYTEAQMDYITEAIKTCYNNHLQTIEVREEVQERYNRELDAKMAKTTWGGGGDSWYYTASGRNTTLYPGFATDYVLSVKKFELSDYNYEKESKFAGKPAREKLKLAK